MMPLCTTAIRPVAVGVGMRVLLARLAVRGPPRVADPGRAFERLLAERVREVDELAEPATHAQLLVLDDGDARRVVAAVLESCEPAEEHFRRLAWPDVSDDSAHR